MVGDPPQRKPNRLTYWDYSRPAHYFLTICSHLRQCLFGNIIDGQVELSAFGELVRDCLLRSFELRRELTLDQWVIMPNHIHLILVLSGADHGTIDYSREELQRERKSISSFAAGFKGASTAAINTYRSNPGQPVFQRGFYDHVIRSEEALFAIRNYIINNPAQWQLDRLHPANRSTAHDELDQLINLDSRTRFEN